ncbi:PKD domain-containing protein, partial [Fusibacter sp. A2]|uniref:PKD domain-containing protein n=1 Tax=Fusibacter sp. A2 TaxID=2929473 RepID=UPI0020C07058
FTGGTTGTALYGFLSNFGQLEFPEKTYKCIDQPVTLDAGYAQSYKWWKGHESDEPADGSSLVLSTSGTYTGPASEADYYCGNVNQDPFIINTKTEILNDKFETIPTLPKYAKKGSSYSFGANVWRDIAKSYTWTIGGGTPPSATTKDVTSVSWAATGKYNVGLRIDNTDLGCDTTMTKEILVYDIQDDYANVSKNQSITIDVLS